MLKKVFYLHVSVTQKRRHQKPLNADAFMKVKKKSVY